MPLTTDQIAAKIAEIYKKNQELGVLANQRSTAEAALALQYKVDECNQKRAALSQSFGTLMNQKRQEIRAIEAELGSN